MNNFLRALVLALLPLCAMGQQSLLQGGPSVAGHAPMYTQSGSSQPVVMDSGPASGARVGYGFNEFLLQERGTGTPPFANAGDGPNYTNVCDYDGPAVGGAGYHALCFGPNAGGNGVISYNSFGSAVSQPLNIISPAGLLLNGIEIPNGATPPLGILYASNYGVKCDGSTDNTGFLQSAVNIAVAAGPGATLQIQGGTCNISGPITITGALTIQGVGDAAAGGTIVYQTSSTADGFDVNTNSPVNFDNFRIQSLNNTAGAGISITGPSANTDSKLTRMETEGFWDNVRTASAAGWYIGSSRFLNYGHDGVHVQGAGNCQDGCGADGARSAFIGNAFIDSSRGGSNAGVEINAGGDIQFIANKCYQSAYCVELNLTYGPTGTLLVGYNSMEEQSAASVGIRQAVSGREYSNVTVVSNQLSSFVTFPASGQVYVAPGIPNTEPNWVRNVTVSHNIVNSSSTLPVSMFNIADGNSVSVESNIINNNGGANATGVGCASAASNVAFLYNVANQLPGGLYGSRTCSPLIIDTAANAPLSTAGGTVLGPVDIQYPLTLDNTGRLIVSNNTNTGIEESNTFDGVWSVSSLAHSTAPIGGFHISLNGVAPALTFDTMLNAYFGSDITGPSVEILGNSGTTFASWLKLSGVNGGAGGATIDTSAGPISLLKHSEFHGSSPTVTAGTGATIVGNDNTGRVIVGTSPSTTVQLTFNSSWTNQPICFAQDESSSVTMKMTTVSTSGATFLASGTLTAGDSVSYSCRGFN